jgi:hypothetical protein
VVRKELTSHVGWFARTPCDSESSFQCPSQSPYGPSSGRIVEALLVGRVASYPSMTEWCTPLEATWPGGEGTASDGRN